MPNAQQRQEKHTTNSPYTVHGKPLPWNTVKQVVSLHPRTVEKKVLARTDALRQRLDNIEAQEVIRQEAVKQQERRLKKAKTRIARLLNAEKGKQSKLAKNKNDKTYVAQ